MIHKTKDGLIFKTKPWKHQLKALRYLMKPEHSSAAILLGMGAGKTKIFIDLINNMDFHTTLIVCPHKATRVWVNQIPIHSFDTSIHVVNLSEFSGKKKYEVLQENTRKANSYNKIIYVINYEAVWREPLRTFFKDKMHFDAIICDESHRIKSPSSKVSKFMQTLGRRCDHRYIATGTLLAQTPLDVYAQYRFMNPNVFGTNYSNFCKRYSNIDPYKTMRLGYPVLDKNEPYIHLDELRDKIMSCAFNTKIDLDLPETLDIPVEFELPKKVVDMYSEIRKEGILSLESGTMEINNVVSLVLRLQQLTSGFIPVEDETKKRTLEIIDNSKCNALKELLMDFPKEEPIVVFARFRQDIENIKDVCISLERTYSEMSGKCDDFDDWNNGKTSILIVQIQSGAEGLDFTRAHYGIYYTLTHALYQYNQSRKRLHRPGQKHSVVYYTLVGKLKTGKSVDEQIIQSLKNNEDFIQRVISDKIL